jgi:hypothetical protein
MGRLAFQTVARSPAALSAGIPPGGPLGIHPGQDMGGHHA